MIAIVNIGPQTSDPGGERTYEVRINSKVICTFQHYRREGLAECLRRAADAVETKDINDFCLAHAAEQYAKKKKMTCGPAGIACAKCGAPIPLESHLEWMRRMNKARVELALTLGTEVTPEEKTFLSNAGIVPGCVNIEK